MGDRKQKKSFPVLCRCLHMKIEVFSKANWSDFIHDGKKGLDKND